MILNKEKKGIPLYYKNFQSNSFLYCFFHALYDGRINENAIPMESHWIYNKNFTNLLDEDFLKNEIKLNSFISKEFPSLSFLSAYSTKSEDVCNRIFCIHIDGQNPRHMHMYKTSAEKKQQIFDCQVRHSPIIKDKDHYPYYKLYEKFDGFKITQDDFNFIQKNNLDFKLDELFDIYKKFILKSNEIKNCQSNSSFIYTELYGQISNKFSRTIKNISTFLEEMKYEPYLNINNIKTISTQDTLLKNVTSIFSLLKDNSNKKLISTLNSIKDKLENSKSPLSKKDLSKIEKDIQKVEKNIPKVLNNSTNSKPLNATSKSLNTRKNYFQHIQKTPSTRKLNNPINNFKFNSDTKKAILRLIVSNNKKQPELCYSKK